jgi:hypothetical protein
MRAELTWLLDPRLLGSHGSSMAGNVLLNCFTRGGGVKTMRERVRSGTRPASPGHLGQKSYFPGQQGIV